MTSTSIPVIDSFSGDFAFLSSFYHDGVYREDPDDPRGATNEHRFQAAKTLDPAMRKLILGASTPRDAKTLGRTAVLRPDWEEYKYWIMRELNVTKFVLGPGLGDRLLATGEAHLVEGNRWHDNIWGDCRCGRPACALPGKNWLGLCIEEARNLLRLR